MKILTVAAGLLLAFVLATRSLAADGSAASEYRAAAALTPNPDNGKELFETCRACHNADGSGTTDGNVAAIGGQHYRVVLQQLVDFRHDRRWDIRMEHFVDRHHLKSPQELADVAGYVASLSRPWPPSFGGGNDLQVGSRVYLGRCAGCHGATGQGSNVTKTPRIAGQHFAYTVRQLQDAADGRRPNMTATHTQIIGKLSFEEINGIADYLSRLAARD
ncbi:MAG: c-type cytochrome [Steroidobacteraceae bacterium]